jgi:O-antigen ligase
MPESKRIQNEALETRVSLQPAPRRSTPSKWLLALRDEPVEALLLAGLVIGLVWAPFWLGGDRPLAWGVNGLFYPGLALIYETSLLIRGKKHPFAVKHIAVPASLLLLVVAWIFVQISPTLSMGFAHPIWAMASDALNMRFNGSISVNPDASAMALMRLLTEASLLWLAIQLGRSAARAELLLQAIVATVALYSAYGLFLSAAYGGDIPFFDAPNCGRFVRATFVNRDHFATYAGLGLIAATALLIRLYRHEVPNLGAVASLRWARMIETTGARGARLLGSALVILVALLGTASRGGIFATALGLFALFALSIARQERRGERSLETILFVAVAALAGFLLFGDRIAGRIAESGFTDASRVAVYVIIVHAIRDAPFLGFGYGAFADVFPMYRNQSISANGVWDMAHNTYLETLQGLGMLFGGALIAAVGLLVWRCLRGAVNRHRDATPALIAAGASLLVGAHALVDFSLQIDAVALTFMAILGAGVAQSISSRQLASD